MTTVKFAEFILEMEDPTDSGTYTRPCGITTRSFKRSANTAESTVPNCDDESEPAEIQRGVVSADWSIDVSLTIDLDDLAMWEARIGVEGNYRFSRPLSTNEPGGNVSGHRMGYVGPGIITSYEQTGEYGSKAITASATITGAGKLVPTPYVSA